MPRIDRKGLRLVLATLGCAGALVALAWAVGLRWNRTASYPIGLYRLSKGQWRRGDLVLIDVVADREAFRLAERRGYVREVDGKDAVIRLIKRVVAVEGDRVDVTQRISVNGRELVNSLVREVDSGGRPLPHEAIGGVVRPGEAWVMSDFSDRSFDSRYFGAVPTVFIEGRLRPLLTW
jgi:conjugative transfer signal peptidase TraF